MTQRFRSIFDRSTDGMILFDEQGHISELNPAWKSLFGRSVSALGEVLGPALSKSLITAMHEQGEQKTQLTVGEGESRRELELRFTSQIASGLHLCTARDVSARRSLVRQLQQSQKMEPLGRLAGGVAHDINNMLTVIRGYAEILVKRTPGNDAAVRCASTIIAAADRSSQITQQLLAFSRTDTTGPNSVADFNLVIENISKLIKSLVGEDIRVHVDLGEGCGQVFAHAGQISQLLMNLAVNARDAMPTGGELFISTRRATLKRSPTGAVLKVRAGEYAMLKVRDTGCGIPLKVQEKIFQPFFTTKELGKGTGLGLATVHGIVEQDCGTLVLSSEVGVGTTFEIYLPAVAQSLSETKQVASAVAAH